MVIGEGLGSSILKRIAERHAGAGDAIDGTAANWGLAWDWRVRDTDRGLVQIISRCPQGPCSPYQAPKVVCLM
jgi:hypothetical protein